MTQTIFMVGARGAGKTTIGKALAQALGYRFVDTDLFMQQTSQMTVAEVVESEGWDGFRLRESMALQAVTAPKQSLPLVVVRYCPVKTAHSCVIMGESFICGRLQPYWQSG